MSHKLILKEGAFILADAHYSHIRPQFLHFLKAIQSDKLQPTQLIFMGDMFDALFGGVRYTQEINREAIELLNEIANRIEVIYLEGNHDFNLKKIFPNMRVFSIKSQPVEASFEDKKFLLAHGDMGGDSSYKIYTTLIRSPFLIAILSSIDSLFQNFILKKLDSYLDKKEDCKEFTNFREFIELRISKRYECDYFIEGHFHQNRSFEYENLHYINLAAFACNQRYFIVKSFEDVGLIEEFFSI